MQENQQKEYIFKNTEDDDFLPFRYISSINGPLDKKEIKNWDAGTKFDGSIVTSIKKLDNKDFIVQKENKEESK